MKQHSLLLCQGANVSFMIEFDQSYPLAMSQQMKIRHSLYIRINEYKELLASASTLEDFKRLGHLYKLIVALRKYSAKPQPSNDEKIESHTNQCK